MTGATYYACAMLVRDGRLLLGKRSPHRRSYASSWDVLGGKVEAGETIEEALARELSEEVGIVPSSSRPFEVITHEGERGYARYDFRIVTEWFGGEPYLRNHEHTELAWFTFSDAAKVDGLALDEYAAMFIRLGIMMSRISGL